MRCPWATPKTKNIFLIRDLPYDKEFIDGQISSAHRGGAENFRNKEESENQWMGLKPVFAQIINWRLAEEIKIEKNKGNSKPNVF